MEMQSPLQKQDMATLMTPEDVASLFKVTPKTIYKWAKNNEIPHIRLGRTVRFNREAIKAFLRPESA